MPWRERSAMDEKASFVLEWESGQHTFTALCKSYGISRTLGYRYILRYLLRGVAGLKEQSRAPRRVWNRTAPSIERAIVRIRGRWPRMGPLKNLSAAHGEVWWSAEGAFGGDDRLGAQTLWPSQEAAPRSSHSRDAPDL